MRNYEAFIMLSLYLQLKPLQIQIVVEIINAK